MSKKDKINEPAETYEVTQKNDYTSEELHPILVQLIEKSKENHASGNNFSHDDAMGIYKKKIATNE